MKHISLLFIAFIIVFVGCEKFQKDIVIPRAKIQEGVEKSFPYTKNAILAKITLNDPRIYFKGEKLGVKILYVAESLGKKSIGFADFNGSVWYNQEKGAFYMSGFNLIEVTANESALSNKKGIKKAIESVANNYLEKFPVYRLKQSDYKQNLAKLLLKGLRIEGENLIVTVGI